MKTRFDRFTGPMYRRLWGPAMLSSLGWALSDMADAVVVGQRLGMVGLAAIGLILPVYMVNCMIVHGLGLGGSVRFARLLGQGEAEEASRSFRQVLCLGLVLSGLTALLGTLFLTQLLRVLGTVPEDGALYAATRDYLQVLILSTPLFYLSNLLNYYLRNDGSQRRAGTGSVVGNLCDIAFNILTLEAIKNTSWLSIICNDRILPVFHKIVLHEPLLPFFKGRNSYPYIHDSPLF